MHDTKDTILAGRYRAGETIRWRGARWHVVTARPHRITDDDPSLYGEHLLGHEGDPGTLVQLRRAEG